MNDLTASISQPETIRSLAELLEDLKGELKNDPVSVDDLAVALHERGIAALLLVFAAPMALPLPVPPGINVALATPLLLLTAQQAVGRHTIWLPQKIRRRGMSRAKLLAVIDGLIPWMRRLGIVMRPRLGVITRDGPSRFFGFLGLLMALAVCIPVPLTNTVPSLGIALMSAGFMMRDGLAIIAGALCGMAWIGLLAIAIIFFGPDAYDIIKNGIKSVF